MFSEIEDSAFDGEESITVSDLQRVAVRSFHEAPQKIYSNWDGTPTVFCGLTLSDDHTYIEKKNPVLLGNIPAQTFSTANLLNLKEEYEIRFEDLDLEQFVFNSSMTSDLIDFHNINYTFINNKGDLVAEEELKGQGFLGFSLRMFLQPISVTIITIIIVLYPLGVEEMKKAHPLYDNPSFPGILLHQIEANLGIPTSDLIYTKFGSPILPLIQSSTPLESYDQIPSSRQICAAISNVLRSITIPETKSSQELLSERWNEIKVKGESSFRHFTPDMLWPEVPLSQGKTYSF